VTYLSGARQELHGSKLKRVVRPNLYKYNLQAVSRNAPKIDPLDPFSHVVFSTGGAGVLPSTDGNVLGGS